MIDFLDDIFLALGERRGMRARRRELLAGARGRVLELGAGTGLNVPHHPPGVDLVLAEPDPAMRAGLERRLARARRGWRPGRTGWSLRGASSGRAAAATRRRSS